MRKKLYKAGKNWVVASIAIATVGVIGVQQEASADSTTAAADQSSVVATTDNNQNTQNQQVLSETNTKTVTAAATNQSNNGADDAQALQDSINNNTINLPNGYVNTFNQYTKVRHDAGKPSTTGDEFAQDEAQEQQLTSQMAGVEQVNQYHHSAADQQVAINDVHNLDYDTAKNVDVWFDGLMNNLVQNNDLKDDNGVLLRNYTYHTNNYTINATNRVNNFIDKYASNDEFIPSKGGASDAEQYIFANDGEFDLNDPETLAAAYANMHVGGYDNVPASFKPDLLNIRNNAAIKAIENSLIITNGSAKSFANEKIANLDQLKEKIYNNFILYNLAGHRYGTSFAGDDSQQLIVAAEGSNLAALFPTLEPVGVNGNTGNMSEYAVGLAVNRAGQVAPHWYLVRQSNWGDKDAQPITLAAFTKHQANGQTNNGQSQTNNQKEDHQGGTQNNGQCNNQSSNQVQNNTHGNAQNNGQNNTQGQSGTQNNGQANSQTDKNNKSDSAVRPNTPAAQLNDMKAQQTQAENQLAAQNKATLDKAKADAQSRTDSLNGEIKAERANQEKQYEATKAQIEQKTRKAIEDENASYNKQVKEQKAENDRKLQEAQKHVVTPEQKAQQKEQAASDYKQAQEQAEKEHQSNLNNIKTKYANYTSQIDAQIAQAQKDLDGAKNQLNKDNATVESFNAANFFKSIIDNSKASPAEKADAQNAYNIVTGTGTFTDESGKPKAAPAWYAKAVHLGQKNDATSLDNLKASLELYDQFVKMRQDRHLSVPKVSLVNVAIAMVDADYQTTIDGLDHPGYYSVGENLAESSLDSAMGLWMAEESAWKEAVKQYPDLAGKLGEYYVAQYHLDVYGKMGHFNNLMAPDTTSYGFAFNGAPDYGYTAYDFGGSKDGVYSIDEYKQLVSVYAASSQSAIAALTKDQNQIDQYQKTLEKLQKERENVVSQRDNKINQAVQQENNNYNSKLSSLKAAYDQKVKDIDAQPSNVDQLKAQLQAKLDALKSRHEAKLQDIQSESAKEMAAAKDKLNNDPKIKELQAQIDAIQSSLAKKQQELANQLANLKAKDAADYQNLASKLAQGEKAGNNSTTNEVNNVAANNHSVAVEAVNANQGAASQATAPASESGTAVAGKQVASSSATTDVANQESTRQAQLPQTGNENSVIALALGTFAAMLGLGIASKKRF